MNDEIDFSPLQAEIRERKRALGLEQIDEESGRNSGLRRTPEKRALLARIAERCREAGIEPHKANYDERPENPRPGT